MMSENQLLVWYEMLTYFRHIQKARKKNKKNPIP